MISEELKLEYDNKAKEELKLSIRFAKDARRELNRGNFKIALSQAMEAEKHIGEAKSLLRNLNQLAEMDRTKVGMQRDIKLEEEYNAQNRQIVELETQLAEVKTAAAEEKKPESVSEKDEEYEVKV